MVELRRWEIVGVKSAAVPLSRLGSKLQQLLRSGLGSKVLQYPTVARSTTVARNISTICGLMFSTNVLYVSGESATTV